MSNHTRMIVNDFKTWLEILKDSLTVVGVLIAGLWSLFVFGLGRSFAPNVKFQFDLKQVIDIGAMRGIVLTIRLKNIGKRKVKKKECSLILESITEQDFWEQTDPREFRRIDLSPTKKSAILPILHEIFGEHDFLEPDEEVTEDALFQLGATSVFKVKATFKGRRHLWERSMEWTSSAVLDSRKVETKQPFQEGDRK